MRIMVGAIILILSVATASAQLPCFNAVKIAVCSSSCSGNYCGYNLPQMGKRFTGAFITYNTTGDNKPLTIPDGQNEAKHAYRFFTPTEGASLYVRIREIPEGSIRALVREEGGPTLKESEGAANEDFVVEDLKANRNHIIEVIHRASTPGGRSASYVPTMYLVPKVQTDTAGGSKDKARSLGTLSNGQSIQVDEYIQQVASRKFDGDREDTFLVSDQQDWFLVRASVAGKLKVSFTQSAILDAVGVPLFVGYFAGMMPGPAPIPPEGVSVSPGTDHYVLVYAKPNITQTEFGFKYHLDISLQAN